MWQSWSSLLGGNERRAHVGVVGAGLLTSLPSLISKVSSWKLNARFSPGAGKSWAKLNGGVNPSVSTSVVASSVALTPAALRSSLFLIRDRKVRKADPGVLEVEP